MLHRLHNHSTAISISISKRKILRCLNFSLRSFTVEADRPIKDLTIITEYVGDVDFLKNRENDDGDSIMTLLSASDPSKTLVICPDKRSNIARFINGINNHTP